MEGQNKEDPKEENKDHPQETKGGLLHRKESIFLDKKIYCCIFKSIILFLISVFV